MWATAMQTVKELSMIKASQQGSQLSQCPFIRLRRRPQAYPWMNAQTINMLWRDVAPKLRRITAS